MTVAFQVRADTLTASVENTEIPYGETIQLSIIYEGNNGNTLHPDLSVLQDNYTIYSTATSIQSNYINGKSTQKREWHVSLLPNTEGKQIIPEITVGQFKTNPLEINILPSDAKVQPRLKKGAPVAQAQDAKFAIDLKISEEAPYVQQEVNAVLTIHDNRGITLQQEPVFTNASDWIIKTLREPMVEEKNGQREIKFYYAMFPQKSGKLALPTVQVDGFYTSYDDSNSLNQNIGGFFRLLDMDINTMFGVQKPVVLKTKEKTINVKPIAVENGDNWWLPAQALGLTSRWQEDKPQFKVGETVAREFTLTVAGVAETQLPELAIGESENIKQYPENPQVTSIVSDDKVISQSVARIVYIPQEAGEQILPEVKVAWFDVINKKMQYAVVPAAKIIVTGGIQKVLESSKDDQTKEEIKVFKQKENNEKNKEDGETRQQAKYIVLIVLSFLMGLLFSLLLTRKKAKSEHQPTLSEYVRSAGKNLSQKNYYGLRDNIMEWGVQAFPDKNINNLNDIVCCVDDEDFAEQINHLNSILYAGKDEVLNEDCILNILKRKYKYNNKKMAKKPLPDLYK